MREYNKIWGGVLSEIDSLALECDRQVSPIMLQADFVNSIGCSPDETDDAFFTEIENLKNSLDGTVQLLQAYKGLA